MVVFTLGFVIGLAFGVVIGAGKRKRSSRNVGGNGHS